MPTVLTKFDAAERQLLLAIRLFFKEEDAVSIHTLSEAASQVLYDIGEEYGVQSLIRDNNRIREENRKEWLNYIFKSRNFFKHADRDKNETHEFKDEFNEFSLLDAVNLHTTIKKMWTPETFMFDTWFSLSKPDLLIEGTEYTKKILDLRSRPTTPSTDEKHLFDEVICSLRRSEVTIPNVTLALGL